MKAYWTDKKSNGQPLESGTFARVIDMEDGTHPQWVYGRSEEEVWGKIEQNNMHAQAALARRAAPVAQPGRTAPAATIPARMTAGERMQAMAERDNPVTAGEATARLIADDTGIDFKKLAMDNFVRLAEEWENETPEFYPHKGNRTLLGTAVKLKVNFRVGLITKQMMDETFAELRDKGQLFDEPQSVTPPVPPPNNLETFPGENQVRSVTRERGARFATGISARRLGSPQIVQPKNLKYTKEQIDTMPTSVSRRLNEAKDPDYELACATYYPEPSAARA